MVREEQNIGWVTETCKKCKCAFMYYDKLGVINDEPTGKFLCPECVKKVGKQNKTGRLTPEQFLKNSGIKDKIVCKEFKKICKLRGKNRSYDSLLKEAIEVASYIKGE